MTVEPGSLSRHMPSAHPRLVRSVSTLHELQVVGGGEPTVSAMMQVFDTSVQVQLAENVYMYNKIHMYMYMCKDMYMLNTLCATRH